MNSVGPSEKIFREEVERARLTGRCMACDAPTKLMRCVKTCERHAQVCLDALCMRYYQSLYATVRRERQRSQK